MLCSVILCLSNLKDARLVLVVRGADQSVDCGTIVLIAHRINSIGRIDSSSSYSHVTVVFRCA